jgi:hypothetical protein
VITPSGAKQNTGWVQEYPPLQYFNWLGKYTYEWLNYLERNTDASLGGGGPLVGLEIAIGVILPTTGNHRIDTQGFAATDDLTNINVSNLADGRILILRSTSAARVITVKHAAGGSYPINLRNSADIVLDDPRKALVLIRNGNEWDELFSFVGSDPAPYLSADLDVQAKKITTTTVDGDVIIEPNGTGSLSPLTTGKALGKSAQRWNAFLSGANVAGNVSPEADGTRALGSTGTRWASTFADQISATDWVRTAALDTEASGGTLAIGGTNATIINIGRTGATIALYGSITEVHTTNTYVADKLITLNDGGLATSGDGAGIKIEENGSATGYFKVASNRNKWSFKAPNNAAVVSIGAEATVVGDIGLVSSVFTFMSNGFSWKNSAGKVIFEGTDSGNTTLYNDQDSLLFSLTSFSNNPVHRPFVRLRHARGTQAAPTQTKSGDQLGAILFYGYNAGTYYSQGGWVCSAASDITAAGGGRLYTYNEASGTDMGGVDLATGAWTLGPANGVGFHMYSLDAVNQITTICANCNTGTIDGRSFSARAGGALACLAASSDAANCIEFHANQDNDGADVTSDIIASALPTGAWTLGPDSSTGNNLIVNGYSSLGNSTTAGGSGTPAFAVKKLSGTFAANTSTLAIAHGLTQARIKAVYGTIANDSGYIDSLPGFTGNSRNIYITTQGTNIVLSSLNTSFGAANFATANRAVTLYVIYEGS